MPLKSLEGSYLPVERTGTRLVPVEPGNGSRQLVDACDVCTRSGAITSLPMDSDIGISIGSFSSDL